MTLRILLAVLLALFTGHAALAHQDTIIQLKGTKLEGLPTQYQPATFSLKERRLAVGAVSVVIPECVWRQFSTVSARDLSFAASWYHDPKDLPFYLSVSTRKAPGKPGYTLVLDLDTLAFRYFQKESVEGNSFTYEDIPLDAACAAQWRVVRQR